MRRWIVNKKGLILPGVLILLTTGVVFGACLVKAGQHLKKAKPKWFQKKQIELKIPYYVPVSEEKK